uniref:mRNA capping enzyme n=1 Tax=Mimivirus LCMiAC01 TaxID=2506608 RepID=A0A481YZ57_9VIRU|nr:MAG: mRNA capping enzyme [Mimivirus LCMiAC01]
MSYLPRKKRRKDSSIINLRNFHNWIKYRLIAESVSYLSKNHNIHNPSLLDLAVGRGGDMNKWYNNSIYNVVGIDIDEDSIHGDGGAIERYNNLLRRTRNRKYPTPKYEFYVYDLSDSSNIKHIDHHVKNRRFNIVSCQFAIHYFFDNIDSLDTLLTIVKKYIAKHGFFIGTTMDGEKINQMFMHGDIIKKKLYYLENKTNIIDTYTPYGNKYAVSLGEKKGETHYFVKKPSIEYMVDIQELERMCKKHGLRVIGPVPFKKWYDEYMKTKPKHILGDEEKEFSFLNFSFVFYSE